MTETVLITGASGRIGRHAARAFQRAGWQVRRFRRGTDMAEAAQGAQVIVNGMNPPNYHAWRRIIPEITAQHIAAARASGATVILPGNVYNFGTQPTPWDEATPQRPVSRKGRIRVEMERAYREAGIPTIVLRAGNFIDPDGADDMMSLITLKAIRRGRIQHMGDPAARQAWCYLPDWGRAAVMLANRRADLARFEDVPFPGLTLSTLELKGRLEALMDRPLRVAGFPWWIFTVTSPVWELAREMREMRYLGTLDHRLSGTKLARLLPDFSATPVDEVLASKLPQPSVRQAAPRPA